MILVTTPTGNTGSLILKELITKGEEVRIFVRDPKKIDNSILEKVEVATGSLLNEDEFAEALSGCDTLYFCVPQTNTQTNVNEYYENFAQKASNAIKKAGTKRVVFLSGGGKDSGLNAGVATALHKAEDILANSGASLRALRCPVFFESLLWQLAPIKNIGMFFLPLPGEYKSPQVAAKDIAEVAVNWLTNKNWIGVEGIGVHGAENISHNQIAEYLSEALNKTVRFQQVPREKYVETLLGHDSTIEFSNSLTDMFEAIPKGLYDAEPRTNATTTETTIQEWIKNVFVPILNFQK